MNLLNLAVGLLLPWLTGALFLMAVEARATSGYQPNRLRQAGYGFFLGYALLFLAVLASNAWLGRVSWMGVMALLAAVALGSAALLRVRSSARATPSVAEAALNPVPKALLSVLVIWATLHLLLAAIEVINQPLYPWDAWLAWVYRAKAWFLAGAVENVVTAAEWAAASGANLYTIDAAAYPLLPSVIPFWAALSLGRWSETLVNLPVLLAGIALGVALYGQCRESGMGRLWSAAAGYLLFSLPLLGTHLALAGYADIWMAGFSGLGFVALIRGAGPGPGFQTALGFLLLTLALGVKNEGAVWLLAGLLMQALITFRWRTCVATGLVVATAVSAALSLGVMHVDLPLMGSLGIVEGRLQIPFIGSFELEFHDIWRPYRDNFFAMGNWNLLWVLVGAGLLVALAGGKAAPSPARRAGAVFILVFLATQLFIFGFTDQGIWADSYTAINRLPLHFVPALIFAALAIFHSLKVSNQGAAALAGTNLSRRQPVTAALLAAVLIAGGAVTYLARSPPQNPPASRDFTAAQFNFMMGSGAPEGNRIVVDGFSNGYALLSSGPVSIPAERFRFLRLTLESRGTGGVPILFWRRSDAPGELVQSPVRDEGEVVLDLAADESWRGEVSEFGLLFEEVGGTYALGSVSLQPDSLGLRLQLTWNSWTAFEAWTQKSINHLQGGRPEQLLRLPVLLTAWVVLTVLLAWPLLPRGSRSQRIWAVATLAFLAAWMVLDLRWTTNSLRQAGQTLETYGGLSEDDRLALGLDGTVYRYVTRLKTDLLPAKPARILIVGDEQAVEYYLQRAKYHLLPHSVLAVRRFPPDLAPSSLDYVIFIGPAGGIHSVPGWGPAWERLLRPIDRDELAEAFAVARDTD